MDISRPWTDYSKSKKIRFFFFFSSLRRTSTELRTAKCECSLETGCKDRKRKCYTSRQKKTKKKIIQKCRANNYAMCTHDQAIASLKFTRDIQYSHEYMFYGYSQCSQFHIMTMTSSLMHFHHQFFRLLFISVLIENKRKWAKHTKWRSFPLLYVANMHTKQFMIEAKEEQQQKKTHELTKRQWPYQIRTIPQHD